MRLDANETIAEWINRTSRFSALQYPAFVES
jgi:hypothetical protein